MNNYRMSSGGRCGNFGNQSCGCNNQGMCNTTAQDYRREESCMQKQNCMQNCTKSIGQDCVRKGDMEGFPIAMSYVPWQQWNCVFEPVQAIACGTIFPELELPFFCTNCNHGMRGDR